MLHCLPVLIGKKSPVPVLHCLPVLIGKKPPVPVLHCLPVLIDKKPPVPVLHCLPSLTDKNGPIVHCVQVAGKTKESYVYPHRKGVLGEMPSSGACLFPLCFV